jgi:hypothetical protein
MHSPLSVCPKAFLAACDFIKAHKKAPLQNQKCLQNISECIRLDYKTTLTVGTGNTASDSA